MGPNVELIKKSLKKEMGNSDPEAIKIFKEFGIKSPTDLSNTELTDKEIVRLYDKISNHKYRNSKMQTENVKIKSILKLLESEVDLRKDDKIKSGLERYPEFESAVQTICDSVEKVINSKASKINSEMPYKAQFLLEEVIKELSKRV